MEVWLCTYWPGVKKWQHIRMFQSLFACTEFCLLRTRCTVQHVHSTGGSSIASLYIYDFGGKFSWVLLASVNMVPCTIYIVYKPLCHTIYVHYIYSIRLCVVSVVAVLLSPSRSLSGYEAQSREIMRCLACWAHVPVVQVSQASSFRSDWNLLLLLLFWAK